MTPFISDEQASNAFHWLESNAKAIGEARAALILAERMVERTKALEMKRHSDLPVSAQEREARASEALEAAFVKESKAAGEWETLRAYRDLAFARIEAWRSLTATQRALSK